MNQDEVVPLIPFSPLFHAAASPFDATPPLPTNRAVGLCHFHATDPTRTDVSTGTRQFMVSVFYPAVLDETVPRAHLTDILSPNREKALELLSRDRQLTPDEKEATFARLQSLTLRAGRELSPAIGGPYPVLIYYPGGVSHRLSNSALCEQLASTGAIVFALDAPRDAPVVAFPDGQLVPFIPDGDEDTIWPRVADVQFLLDQLETLNATGPFAGKLDLSRVGMFGHSRGGYLANICAVEDARIRAAVNMDGFLWGLWTEGTGLEQYPPDFQQRARALQTPILRLRSQQESPDAARRAFESEAKDFGGDFIFVAIHGFQHSSFATTPWLNGPPEGFIANAAQEPPSSERVEFLTILLSNFFNTYLKNNRLHKTFVTHPPVEMNVFSRCKVQITLD